MSRTIGLGVCAALAAVLAMPLPQASAAEYTVVLDKLQFTSVPAGLHVGEVGLARVLGGSHLGLHI